MTSIPQVATIMQQVLTDATTDAAHATGMVRRERAITGAQFV